MTTTTFNSMNSTATLFTTGSDIVDAQSRTMNRIIDGICREVTIRRAQTHLQELPVYLLEDIGIERSAIETATRTGAKNGNI